MLTTINIAGWGCCAQTDCPPPQQSWCINNHIMAAAYPQSKGGKGDRPRSRSARARLSSAGHGRVGPSFDRDALVMEAKERATSAKMIRGKHTNSTKVFPGQQNVKSGKERFTSMYSTDFDGSFAAPPELRPTSPTRRNNPHPAKVSYSAATKGGGADQCLHM